MRGGVVMSGFSVLYTIWAILNTVMLFIAGYPQKTYLYLRKFPVIDVHWNKFFDQSNKFYLISGDDLAYYDITEYVLALLIPLFVVYLKKSFKRRTHIYQKPPTH